MATRAARPTESKEWKALEQHYAEIKDLHLRDLFAKDPGRGQQMTIEALDLYLDYSKHRVTEDTMRLLRALAQQASLRTHIEEMFAGQADQRDREARRAARRAPRAARAR